MCQQSHQHNHDHAHPHHHHHDHSHHHHNPDELHTQPAVLDIGEDIGALIIYTEPALRGVEIDVSLNGKAAKRVHTAVLERAVNGQNIFAALYMSLEAGDYTIWKTETEPVGPVSVVGGSVTELDWRLLK